ncbi:oligosaccharide flippase family protein [Tianweitania sp.]|uniref:oligosaccharide flippase family protein n=1 Tax=Tianweitania sp. TaxID=2021634 RepID=UPI0028A01423|nr:oligosaccharide flippase family protein [Tianweitania sp.]
MTSAAFLRLLKRLGTGDSLYFISARTFMQVSQFVIFIVAARVLAPAQFGMFALGSAVAILLAKLGEAGWREYVLSSRSPTAVASATTAALISGLVSTSICFAAATVAASLFATSEMGWLLAFFALWLLPAGISSVQAGVMIRSARVRALSMVQILGELFGLACSLASLNAGFGLLSLVYGRLACQIFSLLAFVSLIGAPRLIRLDRATASELIEFSRQILATRLIAFFRSYGATFIIGFLLGPASTGLFRAAERLVVSLSEVLAETVQVIAWKNCSRSLTQTDERGAQQRFLAREAEYIHPILLATSAPIFLGLALVSGNVIEVVLGPAWTPAAAVASLIAIRQLLLMPGFVTEPLLATMGEVRRMPPVSLFNALLALVLVLVCAPFGILAVAVGQCIAAGVSLSFQVRLQSRYAGVAFDRVLRRAFPILPALVAMAVAVTSAQAIATEENRALWSVLALQIVSGALAYAGTLLIVERLTSHERSLLYRPVTA